MRTLWRSAYTQKTRPLWYTIQLALIIGITQLRLITEYLHNLRPVSKCQATCVVGELRSFSACKLESVLRHVGVVDCHDVYVVASQTKRAKRSPYWVQQKKGKNQLKRLKDLVLNTEHRIQNDFKVQRPFRTSDFNATPVNFSNIYISDFSGDLSSKYKVCFDMILKREKELRMQYGIIAKVRPDAIWYSHLSNYIHVPLSKTVVITSHGETAWIGTRKLHPTYISQESSDVFRLVRSQKTTSTFKFLPWALCREKDVVGAYFNYLDTFLNHGISQYAHLGVVCYRLYSMFGESIFSKTSQNITFPIDFLSQFNAWLQTTQRLRRNVLFPICGGFPQVGTGAPIVKHDVEICNAWEEFCGLSAQHNLSMRLDSLLQDLMSWSVTTSAFVSKESERAYCQYYVGAFCDMIRSLRFIAIASGMNESPSFPKVDNSEKNLDVCEAVEQLKLYANQSKHETEHFILDRKEHQICTRFLPFDWYYWNTDDFRR